MEELDITMQCFENFYLLSLNNLVTQVAFANKNNA